LESIICSDIVFVRMYVRRAMEQKILEVKGYKVSFAALEFGISFL